MTMELADDILRRIDETQPDTYVVFLTRGVRTSSITFNAGRRGTQSWRGGNDFYPTNGSSSYRFDSDTVEHVARIGGLVHVGDEVVLLSRNLYGRTGLVASTPYSDGGIDVTFNGQLIAHTSLYIRLRPVAEGEADWYKKYGPEAVAAEETPVTPEDMELSEWWIARIKRIAKEAKRKHGLCSQIDSVVKELLEPILPKFFVQAKYGTNENGYNVVSPNTEVVAWFADKADAEADANRRTKKLNA